MHLALGLNRPRCFTSSLRKSEKEGAGSAVAPKRTSSCDTALGLARAVNDVVSSPMVLEPREPNPRRVWRVPRLARDTVRVRGRFTSAMTVVGSRGRVLGADTIGRVEQERLFLRWGRPRGLGVLPELSVGAPPASESSADLEGARSWDEDLEEERASMEAHGEYCESHEGRYR